jgi:NAD-dependent dihydropyrimidine dehydrogenase PreA subunit
MRQIINLQDRRPGIRWDSVSPRATSPVGYDYARPKTPSRDGSGHRRQSAAGVRCGAGAVWAVANIPVMINQMAYIICEPCIGTKDTACVDVCPVDCIHPRKDEPEFGAAEMLYIHPDECIDCGACVPACPVEAIFSLDETPHKWSSFIRTNAEYYADRG